MSISMTLLEDDGDIFRLAALSDHFTLHIFAVSTLPTNHRKSSSSSTSSNRSNSEEKLDRSIPITSMQRVYFLYFHFVDFSFSHFLNNNNPI